MDSNVNDQDLYYWHCLKLPGIHLPNTGVVFSTLLFQLLVVHGFILFFHHLIFARLRLTPIATQMFTGLFLSPYTPLLNVYSTPHAVLFPPGSRNIDESLSMLSYMMYSFIIAVKMDFSIVVKTGHKAFVIGILDTVVPIILDLAFLLHNYPDLFDRIGTEDQVVADLYINLTTLPLTHFPNIAILLSDMKMINSELGRLALSSSLIGHILSIVLLLIANVITLRISDPIRLFTPFVLFLVSAFVFRPILNWMVKQTPKGRSVKPVFVNFGYLLMLVGALTTQYAGQLILLGAFIVGSVVPDGLPYGAAIVEKLDFFVSRLLLPFFVATSLMGGDYKTMINSETIMFDHFSLAILAYLAKFFNGLLCGLCSKMEFTDALALSFIMSIKGIVDIGALIMFRESNVLSTPSYTVMVLWTLFVATITPVFVRSLYHPLRKYAGYQRRDIVHSKYGSELRILTCFLRSDCVTSITRFLNACSPSENNLISVYALHLINMVGRSHPIFIAHDMQKKKASSNSYSEDVLWAFFRFEQKFKSFLSIHVFTAVSPFEIMYEDTCTLALDKLASIIVLPFHRRFSFDGSIDFEDNEQRILNSGLLNKAPCSVGVLVDRGTFGQKCPSLDLKTMKTTDSGSPLLVALIYLGGQDDQEALAFAKRISRDSRVNVSVIRLVSYGQVADLDPLDSAALMDAQKNVLYNEQFSYIEKSVKDGADTATFLKLAVESFNLVMVGRHYNFSCSQLVGLKDMSEETELGAIGDFLASDDLGCRTSVLVVQQQRHWAFT